MTQTILQTEHPNRNSKIRHNRRKPYAPFFGMPTESERKIFRTPTNRSKGKNIVPDFQAHDFPGIFHPANGVDHRIRLRVKTAISGAVYKNAVFSMLVQNKLHPMSNFEQDLSTDRHAPGVRNGDLPEIRFPYLPLTNANCQINLLIAPACSRAGYPENILQQAVDKRFFPDRPNCAGMHKKDMTLIPYDFVHPKESIL